MVDDQLVVGDGSNNKDRQGGHDRVTPPSESHGDRLERKGISQQGLISRGQASEINILERITSVS